MLLLYFISQSVLFDGNNNAMQYIIPYCAIEQNNTI